MHVRRHASFAIVAVACLALSCAKAEPATAVAHPQPSSTPKPAADADAPPSSRAEREALEAELAGYTEISPDSDAWMHAGQEIWIRNGDGCSHATLQTEDESLVAEIESCSRHHGKTHVRCTQALQFEGGSVSIGLKSCIQKSPGKDELGSGGIASPPPLWFPLSREDDVVFMGDAYQLWVEARTLTWVSSTCMPGTADAARRALEDQGEEDVQEALNQRYGLVGDERRCMEYEGMRLMSRRLSDRGTYDRGARSRSETTPTDCSVPCEQSPVLEQLREQNAKLHGKAFRQADASTQARLYLSQQACEDGEAEPLVVDSCDPLG